MHHEILVRARIIEAKNILVSGKPVNTYVTAQLDKLPVKKTATVYNDPNPFFAHDCVFDAVPPDFCALTVSLWNDAAKDKPIGVAAFSRTFLLKGSAEDEQWFALRPPDDHVVTGALLVRIQRHSFAAPDAHFTITILAAQNLYSATGAADPYAVCHVLPDPSAQSSKATLVKKSTLNPTFNETFDYSVPYVSGQHELHVSVWDASKQDEFLGHLAIPLVGILPAEPLEEWFTLLPKPTHIQNSDPTDKKKRGSSANQLTFEYSKARHFVQNLQSTVSDVVPKTKQSHRLVDTRFLFGAMCGHCGTLLWGLKTHSQCSLCKFACHVHCSKYVADDCGGVGLLRMKFKYTETLVLSIHKYTNLHQFISADSYRLATIFGEISTEREDAAYSLVKITESEGKVVDFICAVISNEVRASADHNNLFRANSMASKAVDVYMKHTALPFLDATIGDLIRQVVRNRVNCEVDATRLDKGDDHKKNLQNLLEWNKKIVFSIFEAKTAFPYTLRQIFQHLQREVTEKFPKEHEARYTAVAGFAFLRFFAPAILGPRLFGLVDEYVDIRTTRTLTLLAKSLQSLANCVTFGEKEPYMSVTNPFIEDNIGKMREYLDCISDPGSRMSPDAKNANRKTLSEVQIASEFARLYGCFARAQSKIVQSIAAKDVPLVKNLTTALAEITAEVSDVFRPSDTSTPVSSRPSSPMRGSCSFAARSETVQITETSPQPQSPTSTEKAGIAASSMSLKSPVPLVAGVGKIEAIEVTVDPQHSESHTPVRKPSQRHTLSSIVASALASNNPSIPSTPIVTLAKPIRDIGLSNLASSLESIIRAGQMSPSSSSVEGLNVVKLEASSASISPTSTSLLSPTITAGPVVGVYSNTAPNAKNALMSICAGCHEPIRSRSPFVRAVGNVYHPACFQCGACGIQLGDKYLAYEGMPLCRRDFEKRAGLVCGGCGEVIDKEYTEFNNRKYHIECKKCKHCKQPLAGRPYFAIEDDVYCTEHQAEFLNCFSCQAPINGGHILRAFGKSWHPECFVCTGCLTNLVNNDYFEHHSTPWCQSCYLECIVQDPSPSDSLTGSQTLVP
ncbi:hypothetical protein SeMB42_g07325 [Synchytrium endobioticum]|uniref:Ras GTPase-activating protein n=1 Tax=Synchytrium endobioticum TaxID=286115 RepID=A0A507C034_9FUNG|nr:hypothetical protein SeMB42_g07325 [Synchytrium endobioticum]TPX42110.1 hypothetical protein SeLEV6574_g05755 [Synchytrium endobioticum]